MKAVTSRQREILGFIHESITKRGFPPTHRELADRFQFSSESGASHNHVQALEKKGLVETGRTIARGIRITDAGHALLGQPTPAEMRDAVQRAERYRGLLIRTWSLLVQAAPMTPLLAEIRDELSLSEQVPPPPASPEVSS